MQRSQIFLRGLGAIGLFTAVVSIGIALRTSAVLPNSPLQKLTHPVPETTATASSGPNVVVLVGCTLRRDQLSLYDAALDTTPNLVTFANQGVVFNDVIAAAPWTRAASAAIFTGKHAVSLGMVEPEPVRNDRGLPEHVDTMAEHFQRAGYRTFGATTNPNLNQVFGFAQGFETYWQPPALWRDDSSKLGGGAVQDALEQDLPSAGEQPLYLQMLLVDAHAPYPRLVDLAPEELSTNVPQAVLRYRASVRVFDRVFAGLFGLLERRGYTPENTLFVLLSDHGEGLGFPEHHGKAHGRNLYPTSVRAMWAMVGPGVPKGTRIKGVVSQVDVLPTVLGLAGIDAAETPGFDQSLSLGTGQSARKYAYSDTWFLNVQRSAEYTTEVACQQDFAAHRTDDELTGCFDRDVDSNHVNPLELPGPQRRLKDWHVARVAEFLASEHRGAEQPDEAVLKQLEAMGYTER